MHRLASALVPVIFLGVFFLHPGIVVWILGFMFAFIAVVVAFFFYADYRQKSGHPIKGITVSGGLVHIPAAFVGLAGNATNLRVQGTGDKLLISMTKGSYVFILGMCCLFGPGGILYYLNLSPIARAHFYHAHSAAELYVVSAITAMVLGVTVLFFYYLRMALWATPVVEVNGGGIRLWRGHKEVAAIARQDISHLDIRVSQFDMGSDGMINFIDNYTLCAVLTNKAERGLCITASKSLTEDIKSGIEQVLNIAVAGVGLRPADDIKNS